MCVKERERERTVSSSGLLLEHERLRLEMEPYEKNQSLIVINWNLVLLRVCARRNMYYVPADYTRNLDCLMLFKKNCNNAIKFSTKNIPYALIQLKTAIKKFYFYALAFDFSGSFCGCLFLRVGIINGPYASKQTTRGLLEPETRVIHSWLHSIGKRNQSKLLS